MDTVAFQFFTDQLLPWLLFSGIVYGAAVFFTRERNTVPHVWWLSLLASFLPFLPISFANFAVTAPNITWLDANLEQIQLFKQATIAHTGLKNMDYPAASLILAYVGVALFKLCKLWLNWRELKTIIAQAQPANVSLASKVKVVVSTRNHSPFVCGIFTPMIVLPQYFCSMSETQQRILIQHELTHIAYKDPIVVIVLRVLSAVLWINPFIAKIEWQFIRAMEHRCDRQTISRYALNKREYAQTLVHALRKSAMERHTSPVAQFNSAALDADDYKRRLTHIMQANYSASLQVVLGFSVTVCLLFGAVAYVRAAEVSEEPVWQHPLSQYRISSRYKSVSKIRYYTPHKGVDYVAPKNSAILAAAEGVVVLADAQTLHPNFGNAVLIQHKGGYQTLYAHLASISVKTGDWVRAGQPIGIIGDTGRATGVHLHLEVMKNGQHLDPNVILQ